MADHFTLDVEPSALRKVASELETLRTNVMAKGATVSGTPGEIGERWTGQAATSVKGEMEKIGTRMTGLGGFLFPSSEGLRQLAGKYDAALEELPGLNRRWNDAQSTYDDAVAASEQRRTEDEEATAPEGGGRNPLQHEHDDAHTSRVAEAGTTLRNTQGTIQGEYDAIVTQLETDTTTLGTTLADQSPVDVTAEDLEAWESGSWPTPDMSNLRIGMGLMTARDDRLAEEAVQPDLDALNEALQGHDPEAVNAALEALGANADDASYSRALVRMLGPDGVNQLFEDVDSFLGINSVAPVDVAGGVLALSETLAHGVSQLPDGDGEHDFSAWTEQLTTSGNGPRILGLLAASEYADGRTNALALAHHQSIVPRPGTESSGDMFSVFPTALYEAYRDRDMMEHWAASSSGEDLVRILEHSEPDRVDEIMNQMMNSAAGGTNSIPREEFEHVANLWASTVEALREDFTQAGDDEHPLGTLMQVLNSRHSVSDYVYQEELLQPTLQDVVNDSALMDQILTDVQNGRFGDDSGSQLKDLIQESGVSVDTILQGLVEHQVTSGNSAQSVASDLGSLLALSDVMDGQDLDWEALTQSAIQSALSAGSSAAKFTPGGPIVSFLGALVDEAQRQQALEDGWNSQNSNNTPQELIAFSLFLQENGPPEGFEEYLQEQGANVDDPDELVTRYLDKMEEERHPDWEYMNDVISTLNGVRDDR